MSRWKPDAPGRLVKAAVALFAEQGYDDTTVAQIAERAGLTKRTFFRYFTDKREVLFGGSSEVEQVWVDGVRAAPAGLAPLEAVDAGLDAVAELFADRHPWARTRSAIIDSHPELEERELIKMQRLAVAVAGALTERGVSSHAATLAAQSGVTVFRVGFAAWVQQDDPAALRPLMDRTLAELRAVTGGS